MKPAINVSKVPIAYRQPLELFIEFPFSVLEEYGDLGNLDEIWDSNIGYFIGQAFCEADIFIKNSKISFLENDVLSYCVTLLAEPADGKTRIPVSA